MNPSDFKDQPRDTKKENEASKWLRAQEEYTKFEFIWNVVKHNQLSGLAMVRKSALKRAHLEVILEYGLVYGDASNVRLWYDATVEGLGELRAINIIESHLENGPLIVEKMLYWLRPETEKGKLKAEELRSKFNDMYPNFRSTRSTGIHATQA
ncbi:hypothetical protein MIB92_18870 [Aestuariirhabdus sp. Z084]|uniref:hypothetical protein n=1 Tax=Aestuariirhabdus haliotis TaxID=2918751 RepID=UPI00201B4367|nr:hypothetical protein [Aestuariirhabdus haliotis]MCL6417730.1 hypothetical protein [Aestuariirhabdus haliotis]MCL6421665.1 hypothetical protein [Aestuariirhabdus haliotis]